MSPTSTLVALATVSALAAARPPLSPVTIVEGTIREAISGKALSNAVITIGVDTTVSDPDGRFVLHASPTSAFFAVRRDGYLDFQYPMLRIRSDSIMAEVELRTDPPSPEMYVRARFLPHVCVIDDDARLRVLHGCARDTLTSYETRIIKHAPWNPYFGRSVDRAGVIIATRTAR